MNTLFFLTLFFCCTETLWTESAGEIRQDLQDDSSQQALQGLRDWLQQPVEQRPPISEQPFARLPLSAAAAEQARALIWEDYVVWARQQRSESFQNKVIEFQDLKMEYDFLNLPDPAQEGSPKSLFISMHGGGETPARVNDSQWRNQIRLGQAYRPNHSIYVAPRAPTNTWNLWHQGHIDTMFSQLIADFLLFEDVDPNRVFLMGYSAGGDGVYQLAPRMADRFAAAAMMAGHPNDARPLSLRNLPFTIHVGENDTPFRRNLVAVEWREQLEKLQSADPEGYQHWVQVHKDKGHWMELEDKAAIPWMQQHSRNPFPKKIVWAQGGRRHQRFYWLTLQAENSNVNGPVKASIEGNTVEIEAAEGSQGLGVLLHDQMMDLNQPITFRVNGKELRTQPVVRTIEVIEQTLRERGDPQGGFYARVWLD